jgi:hypothetical protein
MNKKSDVLVGICVIITLLVSTGIIGWGICKVFEYHPSWFTRIPVFCISFFLLYVLWMIGIGMVRMLFWKDL